MKWQLVTLLILATVLYLWQLGRAGVVTDESSYVVRAIQMVDFDFGIDQPTTWQLAGEPAWWMRLSFHDHPPLFFG